MSFSLKELLDQRSGENYTLQDRHINPAFAKVLKIIGFDRFYTKGEGAYLFDDRAVAARQLMQEARRARTS